MVQVRRYQPSDLNGMMTVRRDAILNIPLTDYSREQLKAWARGHDDLESQDQRFTDSTTWVATEQELVVGFATDRCQNIRPDVRRPCTNVRSIHTRRMVELLL